MQKFKVLEIKGHFTSQFGADSNVVTTNTTYQRGRFPAPYTKIAFAESKE